MALQALSEYAILSYVGGVNLTISLASTNLDFQETFELHRENKKILQRAKVPLILTPSPSTATNPAGLRGLCCTHGHHCLGLPLRRQPSTIEQ